MDNRFISYTLAKTLADMQYQPEFEPLAWYNYDEQLWFFGEDSILDGYAGEENRPLAPTYLEAIEFLLKRNPQVSIRIAYNRSGELLSNGNTLTLFDDLEEAVNSLIRIDNNG